MLLCRIQRRERRLAVPFSFVGISLILGHVLVSSSVGIAGANAPSSLQATTATASHRYTSTMKTDANGTPRLLYNVASPSMQGTPEQAARQFLEGKVALLKLQNPSLNLKTERVQNIPGGSHVRFTQTFEGIPVQGGDVVVSMNTLRQVTMVVNNYRNDIALSSTTPRLTATAAIEIVRAHLAVQGKPIGKPEEALLMVYRTDAGSYQLAYRVALTCEQPAGDWEVFLDAIAGNVLHVEDRFVNHTGTAGTPGSGYVYLDDPLSAAHQTYGIPGFSNNNNEDTDSLTAYRTLVGLDSLSFEDGVYKLKGPWCNVTDIESPADPLSYAADSPDGFRYTRSEPGFDAVMAYYHVTQAYRRILALGFSIDSLRGLRIDPHGFQGKDNSHYSAYGNWIALGTGGVHDAQDADVIWHEYGHAIIYNLIPSWGGGDSRTLGEGFGDYWAGSHSRSLHEWGTGDPQYNWLFKWDGHNQYWSGRILNETAKYPFSTSDIYACGQVWSSALMGIWEDLGRDITDRLVLKSFSYLGSGATATDNAFAVIQADRDLYEGAHLSTLNYWLGTVKNFIPQSGDGRILVVNDDLIGNTAPVLSGNKGMNVIFKTDGLRGSVLSFLTAGLPQGFQTQTTTFATMDTTALGTFSAIILSGGLNATPFADSARRAAIVRYVQTGGKVLVEGGEAGYYYRENPAGEVDAEFRRTVLHDSSFVSDADAAQLISYRTGERFFATPNVLVTPITFSQRSTFADKDLMSASAAEPGTHILGGWSTVPGSAGIIAHTDQNGTLKTLFLPFAVSAIADSQIARQLVENALSYLLVPATQTTAVAGIQTNPEKFELLQNYPNPFNPTTAITYTLSSPSHVRLTVFDVLGREIALLVNGREAAGKHKEVFNAAGNASGIYFYRLELTPDEGSAPIVISKRMILLK